MSSDYPGSGYSPRQPREPQQGAGWQSDYPGNRGYSDMPPTQSPVSSPRPRQSDGYAPSRASRPEAPSAQRPRWMIPALVAALVLVVCAVVGGVVYAIGQNALQEPLSTTSTFCNDLKAQKYSDAYALLSAGYQKQVSSTDFRPDQPAPRSTRWQGAFVRPGRYPERWRLQSQPQSQAASSTPRSPGIIATPAQSAW